MIHNSAAIRVFCVLRGKLFLSCKRQKLTTEDAETR